MKGYIILYDESHMKQPVILNISEIRTISFDVEPEILGDEWPNGLMIVKHDGSISYYLGVTEIKIIITFKHGKKKLCEGFKSIKFNQPQEVSRDV